jgi:signal transduction histidine kinase
LYSGTCFLIGNYARLIKRAEQAQHENLRLLEELRVTNRQLEVYAAQVEELAIAQERDHLARELHDSVTQTVFSMTLSVQAARLLLRQGSSRVAGQLDQLQELARSALNEIQLLVAQLRPISITAEGLVETLRRQFAEREARDGLRVHLDVLSDESLPEPVAIGLYRIIQEALNNVVKHAGTHEATVTIHLAAEPPFVQVEDDGTGFDLATITLQPGHMGLASMAERAREMGWALTIDAAPRHGTRVRAEQAAALAPASGSVPAPLMQPPHRN